MANWIGAASRDWLAPLVELMHQKLLQEKYIHADETVVQVMNEEGRKNTTDSYMWVYSSGQHCQHPIRIFEYQPWSKWQIPSEIPKGIQRIPPLGCILWIDEDSECGKVSLLDASSKEICRFPSERYSKPGSHPTKPRYYILQQTF